MKVHLKNNENQNTTKRKCNEMDINDDVDALEKMLEEQTAKYNRKQLQVKEWKNAEERCGGNMQQK